MAMEFTEAFPKDTRAKRVEIAVEIAVEKAKANLSELGRLNFDATQGDTSFFPGIVQPTQEEAVNAFRERNRRYGRRMKPAPRSEKRESLAGDYGVLGRVRGGWAVLIPGINDMRGMRKITAHLYARKVVR